MTKQQRKIIDRMYVTITGHKEHRRSILKNGADSCDSVLQ